MYKFIFRKVVIYARASRKKACGDILGYDMLRHNSLVINEHERSPELELELEEILNKKIEMLC